MPAELQHTFDHVHDSLGPQGLLEGAALEDETFGFLRDGWITLTAIVVVLDHPNLSDGPCSTFAVQPEISLDEDSATACQIDGAEEPDLSRTNESALVHR